MEAPDSIYQIKIDLQGSEPSIWRRILMPGNTTLWELHTAIEDAMGWPSGAGHHFVVNDEWGEVRRYGYRYSVEDDVSLWGSGNKEMEEVLDLPGYRMEYVRGDIPYWVHTVELEEILPRDQDSQYPVCLAGERACPPEDVDGVHEFNEMVAILSDPSNLDWEDLRSQLGDGFDPVRFDPGRVRFERPDKRWRQMVYPEEFNGEFNILELEYIDPMSEEVDMALLLYIDDILRVFAMSPEGQQFTSAFGPSGFVIRCFIDLGYQYLDCTPWRIDELEAQEILTGLFPRKVALKSTNEVSLVIPELRAFFRFLQNHYEVPNATEILEYLEEIEPEFDEIMTDPSRFGMAKSIMSRALVSGVDLEDQADVERFICDYNASLMPSEDLWTPAPAGLVTFRNGNGKSSKSKSKKSKRKMAKASKRKNRRK